MTLLGLSAAAHARHGYSDDELAGIKNGFAERVQQSLVQLQGEPLEVAEKRPPLSAGRGLYVRHWGYSIVDFAMKTFLLGEEQFYETANDALQEDAVFFRRSTFPANAWRPTGLMRTVSG